MFKKRIVFALLISCLNVALGNTMMLYDLRHTLKMDQSSPEEVRNAWDHCHTVSALQGIVNRDVPRLYIRYVQSQHRSVNVDDYWLEKNRQEGQWLAGSKLRKIKTIEKLVEMYKKFLKGAVVYDPKVAATSNVASAVAGADDLLPVRYDTKKGSLYDRLIINGPKLKVKCWLVNRDGSSLFTGKGLIPGTTRYSTGSTKCDAYIWMKELYLDTGKLSPVHAGYYIDYYWVQKAGACVNNHHTLTNHDYFVSKKAWFFDLHVWRDEVPKDDLQQIAGTDRRTLEELLFSAYQLTDGKEMIHIGGFPPWAYKYTESSGYRHPDVSTEWEYCTIASAYNAYKDADAIGYGAMANSSFWQHYPLEESYPQRWVSHEDLIKKGYLTQDGKVDFKGREFLIFYVGDYDAAAWLYQRTMDIWDDPARGEVPMMWAISPIIQNRAPMAMDYIRKTATQNDYFVAADNGAGYVNPGMLQYSRHHVKERPISGLPSGIETWRKHCKKYYDKWGLSITGFIIDGFAQSMNQSSLECYESFSPNGIVWQKGAVSYLHNNMPVIRSDYDIQDNNPVDAARLVIKRVNARPIPFHWFRNILKTPSWYVQVNENIKKMNPKIELLNAPTFFELYRIYLKNNPDAANGKYDYFESL